MIERNDEVDKEEGYIAFTIDRKKCWVYLSPKEARIMAKIVQVIDEERSLPMGKLCELVGCCYGSFQDNLWKLIAARKLQIRQFKRARIVSKWT